MTILRALHLTGLILVATLAMPVVAQDDHTLALRVHRAIRAAGVAITGVSLGDTANKATWKVHPASLQAAAQPTIDAFDPTVTGITEELDARVKAELDQERLTSAIVWTIIDTYSAPATIAKYNAARTKLIQAYKDRPWVP